MHVQNPELNRCQKEYELALQLYVDCGEAWQKLFDRLLEQSAHLSNRDLRQELQKFSPSAVSQALEEMIFQELRDLPPSQRSQAIRAIYLKRWALGLFAASRPESRGIVRRYKRAKLKLDGLRSKIPRQAKPRTSPPECFAPISVHRGCEFSRKKRVPRTQRVRDALTGELVEKNRFVTENRTRKRYREQQREQQQIKDLIEGNTGRPVKASKLRSFPAKS